MLVPKMVLCYFSITTTIIFILQCIIIYKTYQHRFFKMLLLGLIFIYFLDSMYTLHKNFSENNFELFRKLVSNSKRTRNVSFLQTRKARVPIYLDEEGTNLI